MLRLVRKLLELVRFSHTVFALPFALLAAVMAWRAQPPVAWRWQDLMGIVVCMVTARSAAMAMNRLVDRRLDADNPRTAARHLPAGTLSVRSVAVLAIVCSIGFVAGTLLFLPDNPLPLYLSLPVLAFLMAYSYTKRFTSLSHFWLGAALMLAPVAAWIAVRGSLVVADPVDLLPAVVLGAAVMLWVAGFDMIYACQDMTFDRLHHLHSVPQRWGVPRALRLAAVCHAAAVALLALLPWVFPYLGPIYWCGVAAIAALLAYEHWLVRPDDLTRVNVAFFHVNAVVSLGLFFITTVDLLL